MIGDKGFKLYMKDCPPPPLTLINTKEGLNLFLPVFVLIDYNFIIMALIFLNFGVSSFAFSIALQRKIKKIKQQTYIKTNYKNI